MLRDLIKQLVHLSRLASRRRDRAGAAALSRTIEILYAADSLAESLHAPASLSFSEICTSRGAVFLRTEVGWICIAPGTGRVPKPSTALLNRKPPSDEVVHRITARTLARAKEPFVVF
jgi:hypothetical protein